MRCFLQGSRSDIATGWESGLGLAPPKVNVPTRVFAARAALLETDYVAFTDDPALHEELFGPSTLLVTGTNRERMLAAARALRGHLTATILERIPTCANTRS